MNCKPGELCLLKYADDGYALPFVGQIHRVASIFDAHKGSAWWKFDPPLFTSDGLHLVWADEDLIPIRGDGITTEEVTDLYLPSPVKERETV
jgi:hypothetical protein